MGTFDLTLFMAAVIGAFIVSRVYEHYAGRNADAAGALRAKATGLLICFYVVGFAFLLMMPSQYAVNPFGFGREVKTVDELIPLLKRQSEALASIRNTVYWFLFFSLCGFGPALYNIFKQALALPDRKDDSTLR